jgi:hypothetical protein
VFIPLLRCTDFDIVQILQPSAIDIQDKPPYCPRRTLWPTDHNTIGEEDIFKIDIREAMLMAKEAWNMIQPTTIKHCWNHTAIQRDPIMLRIPLRHGHGHGVSQASLEAWNVLEDLATSRKTLPEAEEGLKKIYGNSYDDSIWWPALATITGSETTDNALDELAMFKAAAENSAIKEGDGKMGAAETKLMDAIVELKDRQRIFRPLPSFEDLVNPPGKLEVDENPDLFTNNTDIVEAVRKQVSEEGDDDDEIEECSPPRMSRPEMAKLSESLRSVCLGVEVEIGYELSKMLRRFEAQIQSVELQKSTQKTLDGWLNVEALSLTL